MTGFAKQKTLATGRLEALTQRHAVLESAIDQEYLRPAPDMGALQRLKRRRLAIKEELTQLIAAQGAASGTVGFTRNQVGWGA